MHYMHSNKFLFFTICRNIYSSCLVESLLSLFKRMKMYFPRLILTVTYFEQIKTRRILRIQISSSRQCIRINNSLNSATNLCDVTLIYIGS